MSNIITQEMRDHFDVRTKNHIARVQKAINKIIAAYPGYAYTDIVERAKVHDASKFEEPEYTPYLWVNWRYKHTNAGLPFDVPVEIEDKMRKATAHHVLNNMHHPECSAGVCKNDPKNRDMNTELVDASGMSDVDILEMVADWVAMAEELKKNTAREWYDKCKKSRWQFTDKQDKLIDSFLSVFE